jgi:tellurite resistance protein
VRSLPMGAFGAVMGLAGLGLAARVTASAVPGYVRAPAYLTEPWIALAAIAFLVLLVMYTGKLMGYPEEVREELTNPVTLGFCGTLPVCLFLLGGGLAPYLPKVANYLWWAGFALLLAMQVWALARWLAGGIPLAQVNAGWLIILVGGIVAPGPGVTLGNIEASRFIFGISACIAPALVALLLYRAMSGPPLPDGLRPSWFVLLVPPSLIYANGLLVYPNMRFLEMLFPLALALTVALLIVSRGFLSWPFGAAWWTFTFPLDALAYAAARYANEHPGGPWRAVAAGTLLLAAAFVLIALVKTVVVATKKDQDDGIPAPR